MEKIKIKPIYKCKHCNKVYKRKCFYDSHILNCEIKMREMYCDDEEDIPTHVELYKMVLTLAKENKKLKEKVNYLMRGINPSRNILEELNSLHNTQMSYKEQIDSYKFDNNCLDIIKEKGHINGIYEIIKTIYLDDLNIPSSIRVVDKKVYIKDDKWDYATTNDIGYIYGKIQKHIMNEFSDWQDKNKTRMREESYLIDYTETLQKVLCGKYSNKQIHTLLLKRIKEYVM